MHAIPDDFLPLFNTIRDRLPIRDLIWTLEGSLRAAGLAVGAPDVEEWMARSPEASKDDSVSLRGWHVLVASHPDDASLPSERHLLAALTFGVALVRQKSREGGSDTIRGAPIDSFDLNAVWSLIRFALVNSAPWAPKPVRSAQGFVSIPLCVHYETPEGGKRHYTELIRLHVWLPDGQRGDRDFAIHSHQAFGQSWVLAGQAVDHAYEVREPVGDVHPTHHYYSLEWKGDDKGKQAVAGYNTNQKASVARNTLVPASAVEVDAARHTRDTTYTMKHLAYHRSEVEQDAIHATIFFFDASRGFESDAPILGPIGGTMHEQRRVVNAQAVDLARAVDCARSWELRMDAGRRLARLARWEEAQDEFAKALNLCEDMMKNSALNPAAPSGGRTSTEPQQIAYRYTYVTRAELARAKRLARCLARDNLAELLGLLDQLKALLRSTLDTNVRLQYVEVAWELSLQYQDMERLSDARDALVAAASELDGASDMCRIISNLGAANYQPWQKGSAATPVKQTKGSRAQPTQSPRGGHPAEEKGGQRNEAEGNEPTQEKQECEGARERPPGKVRGAKAREEAWGRTLLERVSEQQQERIALVRRLHKAAQEQAWSADDVKTLTMWEIVTLSRLSFCHTESGCMEGAVANAEESFGKASTLNDPTAIVASRFFYGRALLHAGQREAARNLFNTGEPITVAEFLRKTPSDEHHHFLRELASELGGGANVDLVDGEAWDSPLARAINTPASGEYGGASQGQS